MSRRMMRARRISKCKNEDQTSTRWRCACAGIERGGSGCRARRSAGNLARNVQRCQGRLIRRWRGRSVRPPFRAQSQQTPRQQLPRQQSTASANTSRSGSRHLNRKRGPPGRPPNSPGGQNGAAGRGPSNPDWNRPAGGDAADSAHTVGEYSAAEVQQSNAAREAARSE